MANLMICQQCQKMWSIMFDPMDAPILLRFAWCPECRVRKTLIPIGHVHGVNKPPVYFGATPPPGAPPSPSKPPLLLTYHPHNPAAVTPPTAPVAAAGPRQAPVNVLPANTAAIPMGVSIEAATVAFMNHIQGQPIPLPPPAIMQKYFSSSADQMALKAADYYGPTPSKVYARMIAIYMLEQGFNLKIQINNPMGDTYSKVSYLRRDLTGTMLRIARGESISKGLNNAAYNNDGMLSSDKIKYDRYSKNYKGPRTASEHLPAPSLVSGLPGKYWEFYVDRDPQQGASPLSIGGGRPGVERIFIQVPDYVFFTWNHYGSDVKSPKDRSALTDGHIWAVFSFTAKGWQRGLTRT